MWKSEWIDGSPYRIAKNKRGKMAREKTSARVAAIAARILAEDASAFVSLKWADIRALAASYLTQREPRKRKNGRVSLGPWKRRRNMAAKKISRRK